MTEPITSLPDAVAALGALPMPVGPDPIAAGRRLDLLALMDDRAASVVSPVLAAVLTEAERLRARVAELETANAGLDDLRIRALDKNDQLRNRVDEVERAYAFDTAELKRRVAELESERHSTNEALDDAVQALRARDTSAVLDDFIARCEVALSGCCSECDAAVAIVKGRKQAALDNAPVPEHVRLLSEDELRKSLRGHLFGGGA